MRSAGVMRQQCVSSVAQAGVRGKRPAKTSLQSAVCPGGPEEAETTENMMKIKSVGWILDGF